MRIEAFSAIPAKPPKPDYRAWFIGLPSGVIVSVAGIDYR